LPWIANICGVGVWSQAGGGGEDLAGFALTHTHSPVMAHCGSLLLLAYAAPRVLCGWDPAAALLGRQVRLFWPVSGFDERISRPHSTRSISRVRKQSFSSSWKTMFGSKDVPPWTWIAGRRGDCMIAVLCTESIEMDITAASDAKAEIHVPSQQKTIAVTIPRLVCRAVRHFWIVRVATIQEFSSLDAFVCYCCDMHIGVQPSSGASTTDQETMRVHVETVSEAVVVQQPN
jgi:hypothetical protein